MHNTNQLNPILIANRGQQAKMNRLITLASIIMMLYGKSQCCSSTYNANYTAIRSQYNNSISCSANNYNATRITQFKDVADSLTNLSSYIINKTDSEFLFDRDAVSFNHRSVYNNINFNLTGIKMWCTKQ